VTIRLGAAAFAAAFGLAQTSSAEPIRFQDRGQRRAGIVFVTAGLSSVGSSVALALTTEGDEHYAAAAMAAVGSGFISLGIPWWVDGSRGRPTRPQNASMMYVGLIAAEIGFVALPISSALLVVGLSDEDEAADARLAALIVSAGGNALIGIGIPLWAVGAKSPDDRLRQPQGAQLSLRPGGAALSLRF
jgi:hypothetical protein